MEGFSFERPLEEWATLGYLLKLAVLFATFLADNCYVSSQLMLEGASPVRALVA